jgi:hypothetical protein
MKLWHRSAVVAFRRPHRTLVVNMMLCCAVTVPSAPIKAAVVTAPKNKPIWCATTQFADGGPNDWVKLTEQSTHIVRPAMQDRAKAALADEPFIELTEGAVGPYLRDGEALSKRKHIYLVRAAAFYVNDKYDLPKTASGDLPLEVSYSSSRNMLLVSNFALGYAGIVPSNLALVIESSNPARRFEAVCLRTQ